MTKCWLIIIHDSKIFKSLYIHVSKNKSINGNKHLLEKYYTKSKTKVITFHGI